MAIVMSKMEQAVDVNGKKKDEVYLELFADAITEMSSFNKASLYIPDEVKIRAGSVAYDKAGNVAILGSNGSWNVVQ